VSDPSLLLHVDCTIDYLLRMAPFFACVDPGNAYTLLCRRLRHRSPTTTVHQPFSHTAAGREAKSSRSENDSANGHPGPTAAHTAAIGSCPALQGDEGPMYANSITPVARLTQEARNDMDWIARERTDRRLCPSHPCYGHGRGDPDQVVMSPSRKAGTSRRRRLGVPRRRPHSTPTSWPGPWSRTAVEIMRRDGRHSGHDSGMYAKGEPKARHPC
jgi:hypothetical protein